LFCRRTTGKLRPVQKLERLALAAVALALGGACGSPSIETQEDPNGPVVWHPGSWTLVWQDEFEGPAGSPPDPTRWNHETGEDKWANKELEYYTDSTNNAALDGEGHLLITARQEMMGSKMYTSARLNTDGIFAQAYGRFEARVRLARGRGLWPAFWMLGNDFDQIGWPTAGEIDIMEQRGSDLTYNWGSLHGPGYSDKLDVYTPRSAAVPGGSDADFHVYAIEWDPGSVVFLIDDVPYFQLTPARRPYYARWVWDHPFFIILNVAIGGDFAGPPDATTVFPLSIAIDWVRVSARQGADAGAATD
jgi:beta-glucanase (GH16 family)